MAIVTRAASKLKFQTGDIPSQADFEDLHDSAIFQDEVPAHVRGITTGDIANWSGGRAFVNILDYGADKTGVNDSRAAFVAALATGKDVFVPEGTFKVVGTGTAGATQFALADNQNIYGVGRKSIITLTGNYRIISIGAYSEVRNIWFKGSGKAAGLGFQTGIFCYAKLNWLIDTCYFSDFSGPAQQNGGGAISVVALATGNSEGGRIINPWVDNNNGGIVFESRGEYATVINCKCTNNTTGIGIGAGNVIINGGDVQKNTTGIKLFDGTNDGHGIISGVTCNHNTTNLDIADNGDGMTFNACNFYSGNMSIVNSTGIKFIGCDFRTGNVSLTNNTMLLRVACRVPISPTAEAMVVTVVSGSNFTDANNLDF
jgi:hypothetical protein